MSEHEQDLLLIKVIREQDQYRLTLHALFEKARRFHQRLAAVTGRLESVIPRDVFFGSGGSAQGIEFAEAIVDLPTGDAITALLAEISRMETAIAALKLQEQRLRRS